MICPNCLKNVATVHVTEIVPIEAPPPAAKAAGFSVQEQHLCEICAQGMDLPNATAVKKKVADIWKLLQISAQQTRKRTGQTCPQCGMSLDEFRKKGRLGCSKDYEVFKAHLGELLERVHGSRTHVGRVPGATEVELDRVKRIHDLRSRLEVAIRDEAYESAARLRDELKALEQDPAT